MSALIDFSKASLYLAIAHILFNPVFWNTVARAGKQGIPVGCAGWGRTHTCHSSKMLMLDYEM